MAKPGLTEMFVTCNDEARRIEATQRALVKCGVRSEPDPNQMRRAETFRAIASLLDRIDLYRDDVREALRRAEARATHGRRKHG